jgi:glycosyltransferase involved in cell wall biosynthesis
MARGHEVAIFYEHTAAEKAATVDPPGAQLQVWFSQSIKTPQVRWREVTEWKPDIIYSHGIESVECEGRLLRTCPAVLYAHNYIGTCVSSRKYHSFPRIQPCSRSFGAKCLLLYYPRRCGGLNPLRAWQLYRTQACRNERLANYRAVLVASRHMYHEFEQNGVATDRLQLLPLPVTEKPQSGMPVRKRHSGRILYVGRLTDVKGVHYLMEALPKAAEKLARPLTVTVAGDGVERRRLEALADRLGIAARFTGWVDTSHKQALMRDADLLAVPSLWPEPFGLVGLEAGCFGLPAIGYAVGGIPEWLISGKTGELAPGDPPTVSGLADAIVGALADPDHYVRLCRGAWEMACHATVANHVNRLEELLGNEIAPGGCR